MNMERNMFEGKNMSKNLYGEEVSTTAYLLNMCPTKNLENIPKEEAWS